jgi:hypothetical protein
LERVLFRAIEGGSEQYVRTPDLDIVCYFPNDDTSAGATLKEIFDSVHQKLGEEYYVEPKTSAVRLKR